MRDGVALAVLAVAALGTAAGLGHVATDLPSGAAPNATFEATGLESGTVTVEHAGGEPVEGLRVLVYEDRRVLPDRTVHATA